MICAGLPHAGDLFGLLGVLDPDRSRVPWNLPRPINLDVGFANTLAFDG